MGMERAGVTFASLMSLGPEQAISTATLAAEVGYSSYWTAETTGPEAFSLLAAVGAAAPSLGLGTGVLALQLRTPMVVAMAGATLQALHPERDIVLGVGISSPVVTSRWHGVPYGDRPLARTREYVRLLRECLSGEKVDFAGDFYRVKGFRLGVRLGERRPKIVLGALNPKMLQLAGEVADGVALNWCTQERVQWSRERVAEGARRAGRDPRAIRIVEYIRVCVDDDEDAARAALARAMLGYALAGPRRPKDTGYRSHFTRMGFDPLLTELEARRDHGEPVEVLARAVPPDLLRTVGASGNARDAAAGFESLAVGLDLPIVRVVAWRDPAASARAVIGACSTARSR